MACYTSHVRLLIYGITLKVVNGWVLAASFAKSSAVPLRLKKGTGERDETFIVLCWNSNDFGHYYILLPYTQKAGMGL